MKIRVLFSRRALPVSLLIRTVTWSAWSHVEILDGDDLIGADMMNGVTVTKLAHRLDISSRAAIVEFPCADPAAVIAAARGELGRGYDYLGLLGILGHQRDWQARESWFCSELVAWAFSAGGSPLFRGELVSRVTPQHLWMLSAPMQQSDNPHDLMAAITG
jgi:hypothetical protein